jgi:SAM-dependent methyltransferase
MDGIDPIIKNWDSQIELFARYFLVHAHLPKNEHLSLLDVGCGTGSALKIIKKKYPELKLAGCDLEPNNIKISKQLNSQYGTFFISDIESIDSYWDFIYLSNVLEHLVEWKQKLEFLLSRTGRIYILVPFNERITSFPPDIHDHSYHINCFDKSSFVYLKSHGYLVDQRIITTPYAWGSGPIRNFLNKHNFHGAKNDYRSELLVCITSRNNNLSKPFYPQIFSILKKGLFVLSPIYYKKYLKH